MVACAILALWERGNQKKQTQVFVNSVKKPIGQGLPELTPVEMVGYGVDEAGSPLALDNG